MIISNDMFEEKEERTKVFLTPWVLKTMNDIKSILKDGEGFS